MIRKLAQIGFVIFIAVAAARAQSPPWTGVLDPSRAIDWSQAGAGAIPARTTLCATVALSPGAANAPVNGIAIRNAINGCASGQTVKLPAGTWYVDYIQFGSGSSPISNVTVRGAGANSTFLIFTSGINCIGIGATGICLVNADNNYSGSPSNASTWTAGYSQGTTSITLGSFSLGSIGNLHVGSLLILDQLDDASDPGNVFICQTSGSNGTCSQQGGVGNGRSGRAQNQTVKVTNISGSTITITPGLYASNWRSGQSPGAWFSNAVPITGDGVESMSLDYTALTGGGDGIMITNGYGNWVKDVRGVNSSRSSHVQFNQSTHNSVIDSYFYGSNGASSSYGVDSSSSSGDNLIQNNIFQHISTAMITEGDTGTVFAYNYAVDDYFTDPTWQQQDSYHHSVGDMFTLREGNEGIGWLADDIHGTSALMTAFRNYYNGRDPALTGGTAKTQQTNAVFAMSYTREVNVIGNVLGTPGYHTIYQTNASSSTDAGNATNSNASVYVLGYSGNQGQSFVASGGGFSIPDDTLVATTMMRWGNYDVVHATPQFNSGEVPSGLSSYANAVPASHTLPASFYMSGSSAPVWYTTSSGHPLLYPAAGPDVSSGNISGLNGYANLNPAADCGLNILGINPNGSSGVQPYDAYTICGYGSPSGSPSATFSLTGGGASVSSYTWPGSVSLGSGSAYQTIYVNNTGTGTLNITLPIAFASGTDFVFVNNQCGSSGGVVAPGTNCYMQLQFVPTATGARTDTITLTDNAGTQTFTVNGTGAGSGPPPNASSNLMFILAAAHGNSLQRRLHYPLQRSLQTMFRSLKSL